MMADMADVENIMAETESDSNPKQETSKKLLKSILKKQANEETINLDAEINESMEILASSAMNFRTERNSQPEKNEGEKKSAKRKKRTKEEKKISSDEFEKNQKQKSRKMALSYLKCWKKNKEEWKFQKVRQTWLLKHMYDTSLVINAY